MSNKTQQNQRGIRTRKQQLEASPKIMGLLEHAALWEQVANEEGMQNPIKGHLYFADENTREAFVSELKATFPRMSFKTDDMNRSHEVTNGTTRHYPNIYIRDVNLLGALEQIITPALKVEATLSRGGVRNNDTNPGHHARAVLESLKPIGSMEL